MVTFSSCWVRGWSSASCSTLSTWESGLTPHTFLGASSCSPAICITSPAVCSETLYIQTYMSATFSMCPMQIVVIFRKSANVFSLREKVTHQWLWCMSALKFVGLRRGQVELLPPTFSCLHQKMVYLQETLRWLVRECWGEKLSKISFKTFK